MCWEDLQRRQVEVPTAKSRTSAAKLSVSGLRFVPQISAKYSRRVEYAGNPIHMC